MKKYKRTLCVIIAAILLLGAVPAYAVSTSTTSGLNGDTCPNSDFNYDIYDVVTVAEAMDRIEWPSSGNVLIVVGDRDSISFMNGIVIPTGLVVDIYFNDVTTSTLLAHYDTTNGKTAAIAIGDTGSENTENNSGNTSNSGSSSSNSYSNSYTDVQPGDWYYDAVMTLTEGGLFKGYGNGKFGPNDVITYGQLQLVMDRLTGGRKLANSGGETSVNLNTDQNKVVVSRGLAAVELVTMFENYRPSGVRYSFNRSTFTSVDDFPDSADIINWCYMYQTELYPLVNNGAHIIGADMNSARNLANNTILAACKYGLFQGVDSKGTFVPYAPLTRAQFCQVLYNMGWLTYDCQFPSTSTR